MRVSVISILFLIAYCRADQMDWTYDDQENWGPSCVLKDLKTQRQSPINIEATRHVICLTLKELNFDGYDEPKKFSVVNDGHTISLSLEEEGETPILSGGKLGTSQYILNRIHFHWPSEHAFKNKTYPLEIHFIHINGKYDNESIALKHYSKGVATLSVLAEVDDEFNNKAFEEILKVVPKVRDTLDKPEQGSGTIVLRDLLPENTKNYYCYTGSKASPNCEEGVVWIILENPIKIGKTQLDELTKDVKARNGKVLTTNNRKIQAKGDELVIRAQDHRICG